MKFGKRAVMKKIVNIVIILIIIGIIAYFLWRTVKPQLLSAGDWLP